MWLMTVTGFNSVVIDTQRNGRMLIRARTKADICNLFTRQKTNCPNDGTANLKLAGKLAEEVDYPNFKMAMQKRADQANKKAACAEIWWTMRRVQEDDRKDDPAVSGKAETMSERGKSRGQRGRLKV